MTHQRFKYPIGMFQQNCQGPKNDNNNQHEPYDKDVDGDDGDDMDDDNLNMIQIRGFQTFWAS